MPIIEFDFTTKQYHVYVAKTVEWGNGKHANSFNHMVPFTGIAISGGLDTAAHFIFGENAFNEALEKMTELWANWRASNFGGVDHA